jgi:hypothetical protein
MEDFRSAEEQSTQPHQRRECGKNPHTPKNAIPASSDECCDDAARHVRFSISRQPGVVMSLGFLLPAAVASVHSAHGTCRERPTRSSSVVRLRKRHICAKIILSGGLIPIVLS